ncbi:MAG: transposase [Tepidisphaerales bacterium]
MPRRARQAPGGLIYHVLNRAVGRMRMFTREGDYLAFQNVLLEAQELRPIRILAYSVMPNHWHMVLWPRADGELSRFMHWLTMTHTQRWRHHRRLVGLGPLYQGRFKAFPAQNDGHLLVVLRYVERNPLRAGLVQRAEDWPYTSLHDRLSDSSPLRPVLCDWPISMPREYVELVNQAQTPAEEEALRTSIRRGRPFGDVAWQASMVGRLGLQSSVNPEHRPKCKRSPGEVARRKA